MLDNIFDEAEQFSQRNIAVAWLDVTVDLCDIVSFADSDGTKTGAELFLFSIGQLTSLQINRDGIYDKVVKGATIFERSNVGIVLSWLFFGGNPNRAIGPFTTVGLSVLMFLSLHRKGQEILITTKTRWWDSQNWINSGLPDRKRYKAIR